MPDIERLMSARLRSYSKSATDLTPRSRNSAPHPSGILFPACVDGESRIGYHFDFRPVGIEPGYGFHTLLHAFG